LDRVKATISEPEFKNARCLALQGRSMWEKVGLPKEDWVPLADARISYREEVPNPHPYVENPVFVTTREETLANAAFVQANTDTPVGEGFEQEFEYNSKVSNVWKTYDDDVFALNFRKGALEKSRDWLEEKCSGEESKGGLGLCETLQMREVKKDGTFPPSSDEEATGQGDPVRLVWCDPTWEYFQSACIYSLGLPPSTSLKHLRVAERIGKDEYKIVTDKEAKDFREAGKRIWVSMAKPRRKRKERDASKEIRRTDISEGLGRSTDVFPFPVPEDAFPFE